MKSNRLTPTTRRLAFLAAFVMFSLPAGCPPQAPDSGGASNSYGDSIVSGGTVESQGGTQDSTSGDDSSPGNDAAPTTGGDDSPGSGDSGGSTGGSTGELRIFPADNPWNQDVSNLPVHPNSAAYMAFIGLSRGLHPDFGTIWEGAPIGIPYVIVAPDQAKSSVSFLYADESDAGPYPIPDNPPIEGGPGSTGDRHILMLDPVNKKLYELFAAYPPGNDAHELGASGWSAGSGAIFDLTSNALRPAGWTSADAAGLPIFPGLVRYDEVVEKGEIRHALRFTVRRTQRSYIPPATHYASSTTDANVPPMGLRVRLKADFDISAFSPHVQVILRAMKTYGMFVADNGSDWYVSGAPDSRWDDDELHELGQVRGSDFEAVYTGEAISD